MNTQTPVVTYRDTWHVARDLTVLDQAISTLHTPTFLELEDLFRAEEAN